MVGSCKRAERSEMASGDSMCRSLGSILSSFAEQKNNRNIRKKLQRKANEIALATNSTGEELFTEVASLLPPPRTHSQRRLLHNAARALNLGVKEILVIGQNNPKLRIFEAATEETQIKNPKSGPMAVTAYKPQPLERLAAICILLGPMLLLLGLQQPSVFTETHHSAGVVICNGRRGSPSAASPAAMNKVGPISLLSKKNYRVRLACRPRKRSAENVSVNAKLAIIARRTKNALPLRILNVTEKDGAFVSFDIASFTVPKDGDYWCLIEARAKAVTLRGTLLFVTMENSSTGAYLTLGGLGLLFLGLILYGFRHLRN